MEARWVERPEQTQTCQCVLLRRVNVTSRGVGGVCLCVLAAVAATSETAASVSYELRTLLACPFTRETWRNANRFCMDRDIGGLSFETATKHEIAEHVACIGSWRKAPFRGHLHG